MAIDFTALCILVIGKNGELMEGCINQAKQLPHFGELIVKGLSMTKTKSKPAPAISPFDVLNI